MSDLPPDLPRLRTHWLTLSLDRVRERISFLERRQREQAHDAAVRPPVPDWILETGIGQRREPLYVHVGGCHMAGKRQRPINRAQALRALSDGAEACAHCRADTALHVLD
ncbi:hypothetical protein GCM10010271_71920 [Streptomyces kurssanovii]|nr:hypothetical protein GCM10010271_71920 [Streptomyces kurssanovii]